VAGNAYQEFNYKLNINGRVDARFRTRRDPANYLVDTLSAKADRYVAEHSADNYFLYVTPYAPHRPFVPAPRYRNDFRGLTYPRTPAFNETDVSDKPPWIAQLPPLKERLILRADRFYRLRAQDMEAVDDLVQHLYEAVAASGQLDRTYFIFTSDNGVHIGEHREFLGKNEPYETDVHLPLWISGPGIGAGTTISSVVGDVDLAPTIADLTGTPVPDFVDGHSVVPLLDGQATNWRKYLLLERSLTKKSDVSGDVRRTGGLLEPPDLDSQAGRAGESGLHSDRFVYVEYDAPMREFYDLATDPYELTNLLGPGSPGLTPEQRAALNEMVTVLAQQRTCSSDTTPCR